MKNLVVRNSYPYSCYDPFFDAFFNTGTKEHEVMKTDILDEGDHYLLKVNLPEVKKEDVKVTLKEGYLTLEAKFENEEKKEEKEEHREEHKYLRRERYYGSYSRSFYVGEDVEQKDITAKLENGVLKLRINKVEVKPKEESTNIAIL